MMNVRNFSILALAVALFLNLFSGANGKPLAPNDHATQVANVHTSAMINEGRIFHSTEEFRRQIPGRKVGEIVGVGPDVQTIFDAFMDSPSHRAIIVDPDYRSVGIGQQTANNRVWVTALFTTAGADPHAAGINWALQNGIMKGYTDGTFGSYDNMTRGQLATTLKRYHDKYGP